jgi:hypothetical protein
MILTIHLIASRVPRFQIARHVIQTTKQFVYLAIAQYCLIQLPIFVPAQLDIQQIYYIHQNAQHVI